MRLEPPQLILCGYLLLAVWYSAVTYLALRRERRGAVKQAPAPTAELIRLDQRGAKIAAVEHGEEEALPLAA